MSSPDSMFVLVWQGKNLFLPLDGGAYDAVFLEHAQATPFTSDPKAVIIFLGVHTHAYVSSLLRARACALLPTHVSHPCFMLMQSQTSPAETQSLYFVLKMHVTLTTESRGQASFRSGCQPPRICHHPVCRPPALSWTDPRIRAAAIARRIVV